ncbi:MAG TPA: tetratricopeptide repeat protein [Pyrinomonadaceae bacterium]|nr:tetratricopeptide repeat protein [Pyrinomonadaceae bacterium]
MKLANETHTSLSRIRAFVVLFAVMLMFATFANAQSPQLSLADLLIGLRSKKVSLPDRNAILTEAVRQRGVTFAMTPEIEKELETTGATPDLIAAIRVKIAAAKAQATPAVVQPVATPTPAPTPPPPDFSFYQTRADQSAGRGEFTAAITDYNKSLEMKGDNQVAYLGRGKAHAGMKSYDLSVKDFDKAVELNPKDSLAYFNRGVSYEKLGDRRKAMADYQRSVDLDAENALAKTELKRLKDLEAAEAAAELARNTPPEFVDMGMLTAATAIRMITPLYSPVAQRSLVEGRVTVEVELDATGEVVAAKATSGHQLLRVSAEDAAKRSKFKPATFNNRPIKGKGSIIYNFSLKSK